MASIDIPGGVLWISGDRNDRMGPKKSLDQNLTPKKSHAKISRKH